MRGLLASLLTLTLLAAAAATTAAGLLYGKARTDTVGELRFTNRLQIPHLLEPRSEGARKVFDLELQQGRTELLPGLPAETWGANGAYLGPTLRARRGDRIELRVHSRLPETTTIHWHGMHLPAAADGGPHQPIAPGETWSPSWEVEQSAATLWYHPHPHGATADHVYRGIAGLFIIDDAQADELPLPRQYGVDDIPLVIQDKRFDSKGELDFSQNLISPTGRLGRTILVNGTYDPYLEIRHERVRLRLLNASNARVYNLAFADERQFHLVGTDGGLLERPVLLRRIQLSPGERAEIVASFAPAERVVLRSNEPELGTNFWENRFAGGDDRFDLLEIRTHRSLAPSPELPELLAAPEHLHVEAVSRTRQFDLQGVSRINGRSMDMGRIDEVVEAGTTELWRVRNMSGAPHNFHVHGVSFRVHAGSRPLPQHLQGPKDTVYVPPGETVELIVRFPDHPDPDAPFMYHCHLLQHEDAGMMGQFVLVAPGSQEYGGALSHGHDGLGGH